MNLMLTILLVCIALGNFLFGAANLSVGETEAGILGIVGGVASVAGLFLWRWIDRTDQ